MSQISRTISFLKRNGIFPTLYAMMERLGWFGPDPDQLRANQYSGPVNMAEATRMDAGDLAKRQQMSGLKWAKEYRFSIVVPAYETKEDYLKQMMDSVCVQTYPKWQLVIADASATDKVKRVVETYSDDRICYMPLKENKGISENTNEALKKADGDYIGLLDHDDMLHPNALYEIASLLQTMDYEMVYTDEDKINEDGSIRFEPNFKPDFNLDFLLSNNYICHFTVLSRALMEKLSFRPTYDGAQDYDLFLQAVYEIERESYELYKKQTKLPLNGEFQAYIPYAKDVMRQKIGHVPKVLYHWRAHMASTADNPESKRYAYEAGKRALEQFAAQNGWQVSVNHTRHLGFYEIVYEPDIFTVRKDVMAVCGKVVRRGRIVQGPVVDGKELFVGMNSRYSGYLHKAALKLDADWKSEKLSCVRWREDRSFSEAEKDKGRIVYLPDFIVRK